jgi:hypothetical protein
MIVQVARKEFCIKRSNCSCTLVIGIGLPLQKLRKRKSHSSTKNRSIMQSGFSKRNTKWGTILRLEIRLSHSRQRRGDKNNKYVSFIYTTGLASQQVRVRNPHAQNRDRKPKHLFFSFRYGLCSAPAIFRPVNTSSVH